MKVTIQMESNSMGSKVQKKLKNNLTTSSEKAVDRLLSENPNLHEGSITVGISSPERNAKGETEVSFTIKVTSKDL